MKRQPESVNATPGMNLQTTGPLKLVGDITTIVGFKTRSSTKYWHWFIIGALVFPLPIFYMLNAYVADDPAALIRIVAGTLVFSVSFSTANQTAQQLLAERFNGNLKLIITAPVSKFAYVAGTLVHSSMSRRRFCRCHPRVRRPPRGSIRRPDVDLLTDHPIGRAVPGGLDPVHNQLCTKLDGRQYAGKHNGNNPGAMVSPVFFTMEQGPFTAPLAGLRLAPEVRSRWRG